MSPLSERESLWDDRDLTALARLVLADKGAPPRLLLAAWAYLYPMRGDDPLPGCSFAEMAVEAGLFEDPTKRVEATTTPEGAKGWADRDGSAQFPAGGHGLNVAPDASPDGIRAETHRREHDGTGGEPSNAPNAVLMAERGVSL